MCGLQEPAGAVFINPARYLNGRIPQSTKSGPVLFAVMVNDLVQSWEPTLNSRMI